MIRVLQFPFLLHFSNSQLHTIFVNCVDHIEQILSTRYYLLVILEVLVDVGIVLHRIPHKGGSKLLPLRNVINPIHFVELQQLLFGGQDVLYELDVEVLLWWTVVFTFGDEEFSHHLSVWDLLHEVHRIQLYKVGFLLLSAVPALVRAVISIVKPKIQRWCLGYLHHIHGHIHVLTHLYLLLLVHLCPIIHFLLLLLKNRTYIHLGALLLL